ncbi:unannotated protein [freshwater metagenome]|uniref:Unannotated protein n=1 Tax=freshwater metagenome TaxID=449393 RepID=A0A6J6D5U2_9ZZZZ
MKLDDVVAQCPQVFFVVVAPHDDQHVAAFKVGAKFWNDDRLEQQPSFFLDVLQGVDGKTFEFVANRISSKFHLGVDLYEVEYFAPTDLCSIAQNDAIFDGDGVSVAQFCHHVGSHGVQNDNSGLCNALWTAVGVTPRD